MGLVFAQSEIEYPFYEVKCYSHLSNAIFIADTLRPYLVRPVQPPLVRDGGLALPLHDGLQLRQLVLHEQRLLEVRLALHHDDVRLGVDADPGNVVRPLFRVDPHCDATEEERECTRYEIVNLVNVTWQFSAVRACLLHWQPCKFLICQIMGDTRQD